MVSVYIYILKNKRSDKKSDFRFILDLIFIIDLFIVFSFIINLSYRILDLIKFYISIESEFLFFILSISTIFYILNSLIKNILKISYSILILVLFICFLSGAISISKFMVVTLFVNVVNIFFPDIIFLYNNSFRNINKNNKLNYDSIIENRTKEKNCSRQLLFNIGVFILYIYLVIIENDRLGILLFLGNKLNIPVFNVETLPTSAVLDCFGTIIKDNKFLMFFYEIGELICIGILRLILIVIILVVLGCFLALVLFIKSRWKQSSFEKERDNFINKINIKCMNSIKELIYFKKYVDIKKHKSIKTNIKTSIHINSRNNSHRIYKYKNIEFHNKKPNSN